MKEDQQSVESDVNSQTSPELKSLRSNN